MTNIPLSIQILAMVHGFSDEGRKEAVRDLYKVASELESENKRLIGIIRNLRELMWEHHKEGVLVPDICPVCTSREGKYALTQAEELFQPRHEEARQQD